MGYTITTWHEPYTGWFASVWPPDEADPDDPLVTVFGMDSEREALAEAVDWIDERDDESRIPDF